MAVCGFLKQASATRSAGAATGVKSGASSFTIGAALTTGAVVGGVTGAAGAPQPSSITGNAPISTPPETHRDAKFERSFNIRTTLHAPALDTKRQKRASTRPLPRRKRVSVAARLRETRSLYQ